MSSDDQRSKEEKILLTETFEKKIRDKKELGMKDKNKENLLKHLNKEDKIKYTFEEEELIPPDGGWGWLVVLGGFTSLVLFSILVPSYSIIYSPLFKENRSSSTTVSWIFNINQLIMHMTGIFVGPLSSHYRLRNISFFGGVLVAASVILSGFVPKPEYLFILYSFFTGIGQGLTLMISLIVVPYYFDKRKGVAIGISMSGICVGHFVGPPLVSLLLEHYGYKGMTLILGGILLNICLASMLFHPVEWHSSIRKKETDRTEKNVDPLMQKNTDLKYILEECITEHGLSSTGKEDEMTNQKMENNYINKLNSLNIVENGISSRKEANSLTKFRQVSKTVLKSKQELAKRKSCMGEVFSICKAIYCDLLLWVNSHRVKILSLTPTLILISYLNYLIMIPFAMTEAGYTIYEISWTLSSAGIANTLSRIIITIMTDILPWSTKHYFMAGSLLLFASMYAFTLVTEVGYLIFIMCIFGIGVGTCNGLLSLIILEFMGKNFLPQVLGLDFFLIAVLSVVFGPTLGAIRDATGSYNLFFRLLGIGPLLTCILWILMPLAISSDKRKENMTTRNI